MTKEQIENAANAYTQEIIDSNTFDVNFEEDNYDAGSLHATSEVCPMAFKAGALWRINSVWNKPTAYGEELKGHVEVIAHCKSGYHFGKFNAVGSCHEYIGFVSVSGIEFALSDILEYAYLDDLLPQK